MEKIIVADIGGTNARFGVASLQDGDQSCEITDRKQLACTDFSDICDLFKCYLDQLNGDKPVYACLAIAGPVAGDTVKMTNLDWTFSIADLTRKLEFNRIHIVNDFAAKAYSIPHLKDSELITINEGNRDTSAPIALMGPGTGLGVAALIPWGDGWKALPTEGGHVGFSPATREECEIAKIIFQTQAYIRRESILSGPGLTLLHRAVCQLLDQAVIDLSSEEIVQEALSDSTSTGCRTLSFFCAILGGTAGDVALDLGAKQGVYLGGGILPRFPQFLLESEFLQRFQSKGIMSAYMKKIPIHLITCSEPTLLGLAAWFNDFWREPARLNS